jgi:hypothetical protein
LSSHDVDDDDDDDDDDDEQPTVEEQRKLLSLAAEHDRVDVIQALLRDYDCDDDGSPSTCDSLLAGIGIGIGTGIGTSHHVDDGDNEPIPSTPIFVPPPLHVAVAHGSVNAASCLLRRGADPSLRPRVMSGGSGTGVEDRNYKKYEGMSAWELAFGSSADADDDDDFDDEKMGNDGDEARTAGGRGWFGFGSAAATVDPPVSLTERPTKTKRKRKKIKRPLNIQPSKLDGIRNAFIAEAMRAVGSDEVRRLAQLLNAGMDHETEVMPGKTLLGWAVDMDARRCCELLSSLQSSKRKVEEKMSTEDESRQNDSRTKNEIEEATSTTCQSPPYVEDARFSGLSLGDIRILVSENINLIPHLTACRDDLAKETSISRSILGAGGTLSSHSLLELVRALKDQRARAEDSCAAWQAAWEEREDEFDFFWEEVLDEGLREELGIILDGVQIEEMAPSSITVNALQKNQDDNPFDERRAVIESFIDVENCVNALRASIVNLTEKIATCNAEIERHGMSGALSLTRSLNNEVKEWEKKLRIAREGESVCRRKIDIIKGRIDSIDNSLLADEGDEKSSLGGDEKNTTISMRSLIVDDGGGVGGGGEGREERGTDDDEIIIEDFQLHAIVQRNQEQEGNGKSESSSPIEQQQHSVVQDMVTNRFNLSPLSINQDESRYIATDNYTDNISTVILDERTDDSMSATNDIIAEDAVDEKKLELNSRKEVDCGSPAIQDPKEKNDLNLTSTRNDAVLTKKNLPSIEPSHAIAQGMSTAIVVHPSYQKSRFLSSAFW